MQFTQIAAGKNHELFFHSVENCGAHPVGTGLGPRAMIDVNSGGAGLLPPLPCWHLQRYDSYSEKRCIRVALAG